MMPETWQYEGTFRLYPQHYVIVEKHTGSAVTKLLPSYLGITPRWLAPRFAPHVCH
jgi:hypothetical protein